jgi:hypothetical protein
MSLTHTHTKVPTKEYISPTTMLTEHSVECRPKGSSNPNQGLMLRDRLESPSL